MLPDDDLDGDLGTLDVISMDEIRSAFTGLDGLVEEAGFPNLADPQVLKIWFSDGIGDAEDGRLDIKWYRKGYYSFHYTDSTSRNFRWDYHPKAGAPDKHFHPPPDAPLHKSRAVVHFCRGSAGRRPGRSQAVASCLRHRQYRAAEFGQRRHCLV
jgi:hypothetical protein